MNVDDLARRAGRELREGVHVDADAALDELHRAAPRRRRAHVVVALATAAAALALAIGAGQLLEGSQRTPDAVDRPTKPSAPKVQQPVTACRNPLVSCLDDHRYQYALPTPMTWTVPRGFGTPYSGIGPTLVETYRLDDTGGVTVVEGVRAATAHESPRPVASVGSAHELVRWIARRPFLSSSVIRRSELDGLPAWSVEVDVKPGSPDGPASCTGQGIPCYPLLYEPGGAFTGAWDGITGRYTAVDLPGSGVAVVWTWTFTGEMPVESDTLVDSIRWG